MKQNTRATQSASGSRGRKPKSAPRNAEQRQALFRRAEDLIFTTLDRHDGSISAEHGIGRSKKKALMQRLDPVSLDLFRMLKSAVDPTHRMSRGRIFDATV